MLDYGCGKGFFYKNPSNQNGLQIKSLRNYWDIDIDLYDPCFEENSNLNEDKNYEDQEFQNWKKKFRNIALQNNISAKTFDLTMSNIKYLPNVIKYDRYQPEFYEDTKTYISKRANNKKVNSGLKIY